MKALCLPVPGPASLPLRLSDRLWIRRENVRMQNLETLLPSKRVDVAKIMQQGSLLALFCSCHLIQPIKATGGKGQLRVGKEERESSSSVP